MTAALLAAARAGDAERCRFLLLGGRLSLADVALEPAALVAAAKRGGAPDALKLCQRRVSCAHPPAPRRPRRRPRTRARARGGGG